MRRRPTSLSARDSSSSSRRGWVCGVKSSYLSVSAATPGSVLPSRNSSDAPPPVETWLIFSASPACVHRGSRIAAADDRRRALARRARQSRPRSRVCPCRTVVFSNTPIGPFQSTVFAAAIARAYDSAVSRSDVEHRLVGGNRVAPTARAALALLDRRRDRRIVREDQPASPPWRAATSRARRDRLRRATCPSRVPSPCRTCTPSRRRSAAHRPSAAAPR